MDADGVGTLRRETRGRRSEPGRTLLRTSV